MNKKILWIFTFLLFMLPFTVSAGACDVIKDPNGWCDATGEWHDPSMSTIKKNNCSQYQKKINSYCYSICREDAYTTFPNKVPVLSADQYDAILGGNHFIWEEMIVKTKKECETVVDYSKWRKDYEALIYDEKNGIIPLIQHVVMEDNKAQSDVFACQAIKSGNRLSGYAKFLINTPYLIHTTPAVEPGKGKNVSWRMTDSADASACNDSCRLSTGEIVDAKQIDNTGNCSSNTASGDGCIAYNAIWDIYQPGYAEDDSNSCVCYRYKCPDGFERDEEYFNKTGQRRCIKYKYGRLRVYRDIEFTNKRGDINSITNFTEKVGYYCDANPSKPYNSETYDTPYGVEKIKGYKKTFKKLQQRIKAMLSSLKTCATTNQLNNKKDTTSIVVNYKDPQSVYSRNITLEKKVLEQKNSGTVKTYSSDASTGLPYSSCTDRDWDSIDLEKIELTQENAKKLLCTVTNVKTYSAYQVTNVKNSITTTTKYTMPAKTYRYISKETGEAFDSDFKRVSTPAKNDKTNQVMSDIKNKNSVQTDKRYIDIGYPNYPVHFTTPTGTYTISLTYKNIGTSGHFVKNAKYSCIYKVINRVIPCVGKDCDNPDCVGEKCDRCYGSSCDGSPKVNGINVIYRPISLTNPFPGESGKGRSAGINWTNDDIKKYITNNRNVKQNSVYNEKPLYSFTLTANAIKKIKAYNATTQYDDFKLKCSSKYGKRCSSNFLKSIRNYGVTVNASQCYNSGESAFYSCAKKPNQDNVKCYLDKDKKTKCVNCSVGQGHENDAICKEGSGK